MATNAAVGQPVEQRLIIAGKKLFATQGFESATTSAIAREAGTSESQLVKYFGGKEGLLRRIFEDGWNKLSFMYAAASVSRSPMDALRMMFELLVKVLTEDRELRDLMLFEGRRIRGKSADILLTSGYYRLYDEVTATLSKILDGAQLGPGIAPRVLASALIGMLESMLRDQAMSERRNSEPHPTSDEIRAMFALFTSCILEAAPNGRLS